MRSSRRHPRRVVSSPAPKKRSSAETSGTAETSGVTDTAADTAPAESSSPKYSLGLAADGKFDGIRASDHVKLCDYKGINIPAENCTAFRMKTLTRGSKP